MTVTEVAALIGAITGPLGLLIGALSYFRDRSRLWVSVRTNWKVQNSPQYDPNKHFVIVTVTNIGRRPEHISSVVGLFPDGTNGVFSDTFFNPNDSAEGSPPRQYLAAQDSFDKLSEQWPGFFVLVRTSAGRQYRSRFLATQPKGAQSFNYFRRLRFRWQSRMKHRWAFKRRFLE